MRYARAITQVASAFRETWLDVELNSVLDAK